jgi:hypothetical protein
MSWFSAKYDTSQNHKTMKLPNALAKRPYKKLPMRWGFLWSSWGIDCVKCKKKIMGQKFLTHKVGEFLCKKCL